MHQEIWLMFLILPKTLAHPPKKKGGMKGINDLTIAPPFAVVLFCEICKQSKFISWGIIWELKGQNTKKYSDVVIPRTCEAFVCIFQWLPLLKSSSQLTFIAHPRPSLVDFFVNEWEMGPYWMGKSSISLFFPKWNAFGTIFNGGLQPQFFVIMPLHICCKYPYKTLVCNP